MSFQVYIVRQTDYKDPLEESNISLEEWVQYINSDAELGLLSEEGPGFCQWLEHPKADVPWTMRILRFIQNILTGKPWGK